MILVEETDLSYDRSYKQTSDINEIKKIFNEFFLDNISSNADEVKRFVDTNMAALGQEARKYSLSMDNPFMLFLKKYRDKNGNLKPFLDNSDIYGVLHNCVSQGIINEKELAFTCPEKDQIRILMNPNLYNITPISDIRYLISLYSDVLEKNMNSFITNAYVKAAFADKIKNDGNVTYKYSDMNSLNNKQKLLRALLFTDAIDELSDDKVKIDNKEESIDKARKKINSINDKFLVSAPFIAVDLIEHQAKLLRELVQQGSRDEAGRKQQTDIDKKDTNNANQALTPKQQNYYRSRSSDLLKNLRKQFPDEPLSSAKDVSNLLKKIADSIW